MSITKGYDSGKGGWIYLEDRKTGQIYRIYSDNPKGVKSTRKRPKRERN